MIMRKLLFLFLAALVCGCSAVNDGDDEVVERVRVGDRLPAFSVAMTMADGSQGLFSTQHLLGATVVVLFHTTCPDCQRELPRLNAYYEHHRRDEGFQLVCVSRAEGQESVAAFWADNGLTMPYAAQQDRRIYDLFASAVIPRVYFADANGTVTRIDIETVGLLDGQ